MRFEQQPDLKIDMDWWKLDVFFVWCAVEKFLVYKYCHENCSLHNGVGCLHDKKNSVMVDNKSRY